MKTISIGKSALYAGFAFGFLGLQVNGLSIANHKGEDFTPSSIVEHPAIAKAHSNDASEYYQRQADQYGQNLKPVIAAKNVPNKEESYYSNNVSQDSNESSDYDQEPGDEEEAAYGDNDLSSSQPVAPVEVPSKCSKESFIIHSSRDLRAIDDCEILLGNVKVLNYEEPFVEMGSIRSISGNLEISNAPNLVRLEAPLLNAIGGNFMLHELTSLTLVSFPSLRSVHTIDWRVLPILSTVHFNQGIDSISSITISDTSLTGFSGFSVDSLEIFNINNNRFLESISSNIKQVTGSLLIAANAKEIQVELPLLKSVNNITLHDIASVNLGSLEEIEASASFISNYFGALKLPKLKRIGGTLSISDNSQLSQVDFPSIAEVGGGLMVLDNPRVDKINFFPKLAIIGGAIEFAGNIKETSLMKLKLVKGSAIIQSTAKAFDCAKWSHSEISSVIRGGRIECTNANNEKTISTPSVTDISDSMDDSTGLQNSSHSQFSFKNFHSSATASVNTNMDFLYMGLIITALIFSTF